MCANLTHLLMLNERIRDFAECRLDHALIFIQRKRLLGGGQSYVRSKAAGIEHGLHHLGRELPDPRRTREEIGERVALAQEARETDAGKQAPWRRR